MFGHERRNEPGHRPGANAQPACNRLIREPVAQQISDLFALAGGIRLLIEQASPLAQVLEGGDKVVNDLWRRDEHATGGEAWALENGHLPVYDDHPKVLPSALRAPHHQGAGAQRHQVAAQ